MQKNSFLIDYKKYKGWATSLLFKSTKLTDMKVLKANIDFIRANQINAEIGQKFLIKSSIATGWAKLAQVTRLTKTQIELQIINVIPTEESNRFGVKNGLKDNRSMGGFFQDWAFRKKCLVGEKLKFFKDNGIMVGDSDNWNPSVLCELL